MYMCICAWVHMITSLAITRRPLECLETDTQTKPNLLFNMCIAKMLKWQHVFCNIFQTGKLQIFDIGGGILLESVEAHTGAVWSISMSPDKVSKQIEP